MSAYLCGEIEKWPSKEALATLLRQAGLKIIVGQYSVRVDDCSHFSFESFGFSVGPAISADADDARAMLDDGGKVSRALTIAGLRHRFEIYEHDGADLVGYLHHNWPNA